MLDALRTYLSRIDQRPVEQIDRDIDDELAAHLAELEHHLTDAGLSTAAARKEALSRFGNPQTHKRRCRDVALMERRMKTYVQIAATVVCALLLGALAVSAWINQQQTAHALDVMATRMDGLSQSLAMRSPPPSQPSTPSYNNVYIAGTPVTRPGQYEIPSDGISLRRLLVASGVNLDFVRAVDIRHKDVNGKASGRSVEGSDLRDPAGTDLELLPDDLITVVETKH